MDFDPEAVRAFERSGWDRAAAAYEASFGTASRQFIPALLDAAGVVPGHVAPGQAVLDVACGPGFVAAAAAALGASARGLDFSVAMLAVAQARHPGIGFDHGDAEALPYDDAAFDAVVSNFGIHHVPRPALALREAFRVLRPGGRRAGVLRPGGRIAFTIWAAPSENIAWKLLFDAVGRHGDPAASAAPPPGGGFGSAAHCTDALTAAGFSGVAARLERRVWRHRDARSMVETLRAGTARMAAMIEAQPASAMPAILADIDTHAAPWRDGDGIAVPIAAIVAWGRAI